MVRLYGGDVPVSRDFLNSRLSSWERLLGVECVVALLRGEVCAGTLARRTPPNWDGAFGFGTR